MDRDKFYVIASFIKESRYRI